MKQTAKQLALEHVRRVLAEGFTVARGRAIREELRRTRITRAEARSIHIDV